MVAAIEAVSERLIGRDPHATGVGLSLREVGRQSTLGYLAAAAIGNALLDVRARALGVPVRQLLGPRLRDQVRVYWAHCGTYRVSHADLMAKPPVRELSDLVKLGREVADAGFSALKTNLLLFHDERGERYSPRRAAEAPPLTASPRLKRAMAEQLGGAARPCRPLHRHHGRPWIEFSDRWRCRDGPPRGALRPELD